MIFGLTDHAEKRLRQRGFTDDIINFVLLNGDRSLHVGGSRMAISLSEHWAVVLRRSGTNAQFLDRARRCVVIIETRHHSVITVHHGSRSTGCRRTRKVGHKPRRRAPRPRSRRRVGY